MDAHGKTEGVRQSKVNVSHSDHLTPECHTHHQVVGGCLRLRVKWLQCCRINNCP